MALRRGTAPPEAASANRPPARHIPGPVRAGRGPAVVAIWESGADRGRIGGRVAPRPARQHRSRSGEFPDPSPQALHPDPAEPLPRPVPGRGRGTRRRRRPDSRRTRRRHHGCRHRYARLAESGASMAAPQVANLDAKLVAVDPMPAPPQVIAIIRDAAEMSADVRRAHIEPTKALPAATAARRSRMQSKDRPTERSRQPFVDARRWRCGCCFLHVPGGAHAGGRIRA